MTVDGLGGQYMILSGSSLYVNENRINNYLDLTNGLRFNGTLIAFRIPFEREGFNYIEYAE